MTRVDEAERKRLREARDLARRIMARKKAWALLVEAAETNPELAQGLDTIQRVADSGDQNECLRCEGTGRIWDSSCPPWCGEPSHQGECPDCGGTGEVVKR